MSNSGHNGNQKGDEDLAFTAEEMAGPSTAVPNRVSSGWPLGGFPPRYENQESIEMQNLAPPQPPNPPAQRLAAAAPGDGSFNFGFFKPRRDARTKLFIGAIISLLLVVIALVIALPIVAHKKHTASQPQNATIFITTTFSTTLVSTQLVSITQTDNVSFTTTQVTSTTQVTTQTTTLTSLLPNPTSVSTCWDLLNDICANTTQVPSNTHSGVFGDCENVFGYFYCGVIQNLEAQNLFIIPVDDSPLCGGMRNFCNGINLGSDPLGLQPSEGSSTKSAIQVVPVTKRDVRSMTTRTRVAERKLLKVHNPTMTLGPLPTEVLMAMLETGR
ncbi:hypothetical protein N431DRAFT_381011 [Stipitochalara longipes BDJ]|nr:hypothetical protein N431DRAFT_381011 [Stipitochalara longipes BDJ]